MERSKLGELLSRRVDKLSFLLLFAVISKVLSLSKMMDLLASALKRRLSRIKALLSIAGKITDLGQWPPLHRFFIELAGVIERILRSVPWRFSASTDGAFQLVRVVGWEEAGQILSRSSHGRYLAIAKGHHGL